MMIIKITFFNEYNIFGKDASLTYGPQFRNVDMLDKNELINPVIKSGILEMRYTIHTNNICEARDTVP